MRVGRSCGWRKRGGCYDGVQSGSDVGTSRPSVGGVARDDGMCVRWVCVRRRRLDAVVQTIVFVSRKDLCDSVAAGLWDKG